MIPRPFNLKFFVLLMLMSVSALGAEWKIDPTLQFKAGYDDNVRFTIDDETSSAVAIFSPSATFSAATPRSGLSGNLRFDFRRYETDGDLDDDNVRLLVDSFHKMERSKLGLEVGLIKDTTLDSQLEDTGLVFDRVTRYTTNAAPSWTYILDERSKIKFGYDYSNIDYNNTGQNGFVDFTINSAQLDFQRALSERTTTFINLSHSHSNNDNDVESDNTGLQGGASFRFSETLAWSLFGGVRYTTTDYSQNSLVPIFSGDIIIGFIPLTQDISNSDWGYTFSTALTKDFLRGRTQLTASRDISNSVNGIPIEVTRLNWSNLYRLNEILSTSLDFQFYNSDSENSANTNLNRDYVAVEPGFHWDFQKFWRITGSYRYTKQTYDNTSDDATRNAAYLTLTYLWPRIAVSR